MMVEGVAEASVPESVVPLKPTMLAEVKSNNYMLNALTMMAAKERGGTFGLSVGSDGLLRESCVLNVVIVSAGGVWRTPRFCGILRGTTVRRAMQLARPLLDAGVLADVRVEDVSLDDARAAAEVFLLAGDTHLFPVTSLDGVPVGNGLVGPVARAIGDALRSDATTVGECHEALPVVF